MSLLYYIIPEGKSAAQLANQKKLTFTLKKSPRVQCS